jgi:hypothetical protein
MKEEQYYLVVICDFIAPERNLHTINVLIYHGMHTWSMCAGAIPHQ